MAVKRKRITLRLGCIFLSSTAMLNSILYSIQYNIQYCIVYSIFIHLRTFAKTGPLCRNIYAVVHESSVTYKFEYYRDKSASKQKLIRTLSNILSYKRTIKNAFSRF